MVFIGNSLTRVALNIVDFGFSVKYFVVCGGDCLMLVWLRWWMVKIFVMVRKDGVLCLFYGVYFFCKRWDDFRDDTTYLF